MKLTKEDLGKQIEALRKECGVSTYQLEKKGIHPSLPSTIEKGKKGYSMDSLIKYLNAIDEDIYLSVGKKRRVKVNERSSKAKQVINAIFNVTGVDVIKTRKSRKPDYVFARSVFCEIMKGNYNYTYLEIGEYIEKYHTTVKMNIKRSLPSFLTMPRYNRMYNEIKEQELCLKR